MELKKAIETRASVRQYLDEPVPLEVLKEVIRLGGMAPSANNSQPWKFIAVTNKNLLGQMAEKVHAKLAEMLGSNPSPDSEKVITKVDWFSTFFANAPSVIAVLNCPYQAVVDEALPQAHLTHDEINEMRGHPDIQSVGAAVQNILLAVNDLGYGACWLSGPLVARDELEHILGVSSPWRLLTMISVGKPAGPVTPREKKPFEEIFDLRD